MAFIEVKITKDEVTPYLRGLKNKASRSGLQPFLSRQVSVLQSNVDESFRREVFFTGSSEEKWVKLSDKTISKRKARGTWRESNNILKETMTFLNMLKQNFKIGSNSYGYYVALQVTGGTHSTKFSNIGLIELANTHQYGTSRIPARPMFSLLESTQNELFTNFITFFFR